MLIPSAFSAKELEQGSWKSSTIITQSRLINLHVACTQRYTYISSRTGLPSMARWRIHQGRTTLSSTTGRSSIRTLIVPQLSRTTCSNQRWRLISSKNMKLRTAGEECLRLRGDGIKFTTTKRTGKKMEKGCISAPRA
ncbi:unnamed protein product, partial [Ectocarpus sp. 12 AP-2014]